MTVSRLVQASAIDPGNGSGGYAKNQLFGDRSGVAGLRLGAADILHDLAESGFHFPAHPLIFYDLRHCQRQIGGDQGNPLGPTEHPDDAHLATLAPKRNQPLPAMTSRNPPGKLSV